MRTAARQRSWVEDPDLFMAMEDLELVARGLVEGPLHGVHRSPYLGFSVEFDAHRQYEPGDDLRYVNWNLWARTNRLYVKQFKADTNLNLYLLLDNSRSMLCDHGPAPKWTYAARAVAALAFLALQERDSTGLYLLSDKVENHIPPFVRPGQLHEILRLLETAEPRGQTGFAQAVDQVMQLCRRRGLVILLSDLFDADAEVRQALSLLRYYGHEVVVFHLVDPWEAELPERGQFEFHDLETGEILRSNVASVRQAYAQAYRTWQSDTRRFCEDNGIDWVSCTTADPLRGVLVDYLLKRTRLH